MFRGINSVTAIIINNNIIQDDNVYGNSYYSLFFFGSNFIGAFEFGADILSSKHRPCTNAYFQCLPQNEKKKKEKFESL
jgi:hypothetical protein